MHTHARTSDACIDCPALTLMNNLFVTPIRDDTGADPGFFAGGGVNDGGVERAPLAPAPTGGAGVH